MSRALMTGRLLQDSECAALQQQWFSTLQVAKASNTQYGAQMLTYAQMSRETTEYYTLFQGALKDAQQHSSKEQVMGVYCTKELLENSKNFLNRWKLEIKSSSAQDRREALYTISEGWTNVYYFSGLFVHQSIKGAALQKSTARLYMEAQQVTSIIGELDRVTQSARDRVKLLETQLQQVMQQIMNIFNVINVSNNIIYDVGKAVTQGLK